MPTSQPTMPTGSTAAQGSTTHEPRNPQPDSSGVTAPVVQLPKGGGAIRGIGEKFAANPVTRTGSMSVPIATFPGRSGFGTQLSPEIAQAPRPPFAGDWHVGLSNDSIEDAWLLVHRGAE